MMTVPGTHRVTEKHLCTSDPIRFDPALRSALMEWLQFHDIDPNRIPADNCITRNVEACRVEYVEFVFGDDGRVLIRNDEAVTRPAYSQGETAPMPWPAALTATVPSEGDEK